MGDWQQRPGTAKLEAGVAEEDQPGCLAAEVREAGDLRERLASGRGGALAPRGGGKPWSQSGQQRKERGSGLRGGWRLRGPVGWLRGGRRDAARWSAAGAAEGPEGLELWRSGGKSAELPSRLGLTHSCTPYLPPPPPSEPAVRSLPARRRAPRVSRPFPGRDGAGCGAGGLGIPGGGAQRCAGAWEA